MQGLVSRGEQCSVRLSTIQLSGGRPAGADGGFRVPAPNLRCGLGAGATQPCEACAFGDVRRWEWLRRVRARRHDAVRQLFERW